MSDINKNDNEEKNRTEEIQERINTLRIQLNKKKQELEKIKKALTNIFTINLEEDKENNYEYKK